MEDKERIEEEGPEEDVEGHRRGRKVPMQSEDQADEAEGEEDDVEGHAFRPPTAL
jgi:hypothetical protein